MQVSPVNRGSLPPSSEQEQLRDHRDRPPPGNGHPATAVVAAFDAWPVMSSKDFAYEMTLFGLHGSRSPAT